MKATERRSTETGGIEDGRVRVAIEGVRPEVDGGRFPIKRTTGETVVAEADVFADGHDALSGVLRFRHEGEAAWSEVPLEALGNDRYRAAFAVTRLGSYLYTFEAWVDRWGTLRRDLATRLEAGQDIAVDLLAGAALVEEAAALAPPVDRERLLAT
ncbi:MAG: maltotransferase domain-containing protein, partial [Polyangiaceae bacterium]